jgi:hypothetical protein
MFWIIVASVFGGMMFGACVGVVVMSLMVASSRAEAMQMHDPVQDTEDVPRERSGPSAPSRTEARFPAAPPSLVPTRVNARTIPPRSPLKGSL